MAGRLVGYVQITLTIIGFVMGLLFGLRFIVWSLVNWSKYHDPNIDPFIAMRDLWLAARWPLFGIGLFAVSWLWSLITSLSLVHQAKRSGQDKPGQPPKIL